MHGSTRIHKSKRVAGTAILAGRASAVATPQVAAAASADSPPSPQTVGLVASSVTNAGDSSAVSSSPSGRMQSPGGTERRVDRGEMDATRAVGTPSLRGPALPNLEVLRPLSSPLPSLHGSLGAGLTHLPSPFQPAHGASIACKTRRRCAEPAHSADVLHSPGTDAADFRVMEC